MIGAGVGEQGASRQPWSSGFPAGTGRHLQAPPHLLQAFERVPRAGLGNAQLRASGSVFGPVALPDRGPASMLQLHLLLQGYILRQGEEPWVLLVNLPSVFKSSGQADLSCSGWVSRQQANHATSSAFTHLVSSLLLYRVGNTHTPLST